MPNNIFTFKQFRIEQAGTAMKVGTDGVLLGAWASADKVKNILDIGTGTGLIALMLAQRFDAKITAIEIEKNAFEQASNNISNSKWNNRIRAQHISFQDFTKTDIDKYDLIVSNPPFFENSLKAFDQKRNTARHCDDTLPYKDLVAGVKSCIAENGYFCLILPSIQADKMIKICTANELFLNHKIQIKPNPQKEIKRVLLKFGTQRSIITQDTLIIETDKRHQYTQEYMYLTKDFYLKL